MFRYALGTSAFLYFRKNRPMKFTYLLVDLFTVLVPFVFSFHSKIRFTAHWGSFIKAALVAAVPFILWDMLFTQAGVWGFEPDYVLGIYLGNLPMEEILFFFCIPFSCVFTFYCFERFISRSCSTNSVRFISVAIAAIFIIACAVFPDLQYTLVPRLRAPILVLFEPSF